VPDKIFDELKEKQIKELASRCAKEVYNQLGWNSFLGTYPGYIFAWARLENMLPIIIKEILKELPKF